MTLRAPVCKRPIALLTLTLVTAGVVLAQAQANRANWQLADKYTNEFLKQYVYSSSVTPGWIAESDRFWYQWRQSDGTMYWLVDPAKKKRDPLFDHELMATRLTTEVKKPQEAHRLSLGSLKFDEDGKKFTFTVEKTKFEYDMDSKELENKGEVEEEEDEDPPQRFRGRRGNFQGRAGRNRDHRNWSPDKKMFVYAQKHNLFLVHVTETEEDEDEKKDVDEEEKKEEDDDKKQEEGDPIQLTTDGEEHYSFGGGGFGFRGRRTEQQQNPDRKVRANVTWSKDSKAFYISRSDTRKVKDLFLVNSLADPRPTLSTYRYAMPGEENVAQTEMFIHRVGNEGLTPVDAAKWKDQRVMNVHWDGNGSDKLRFVRRDRLQRNLELVEADGTSGEVERVLLEESTMDAFLERQNVRYVGDFDEDEEGEDERDMIWFSERTGWGHFYLYDHDGNLKNAITSGPWRAERVSAVDGEKNVMWFTGVGRVEGENPYYSHLYRIKLDGSGLKLLNEGDSNHRSTLSESHDFFVDNCSRVDMAPESKLYDKNGNVIMELGKADLSRLEETGWKMPETFQVKAADGVTDIYGNMWKPFDFDPYKKYPIILHIYPGPQTESVRYTFSATPREQRLAQLGFIVIQIGNRGGSPQRSNAYHSYGYYNLRDYGLADKKAGTEQLASLHEWIDIERVGIYGHSGGGFMTAAALLLPPYNDFFKVGVSSSGNHDNNVYNQNWGEQNHGLKEVVVEEEEEQQGRRRGRRGGPPPDQDNGSDDEDTTEKVVKTKFEIHIPTNAELAENLNGKLLLVHGEMDNNVHPANTMRLVDALIKANKRFDMMILPGKRHGYGDMAGYFNRMLFEYFAEHLLGDYYRNTAIIDDKP
ncbi:MAG: S9 family peptidase [Armatimonadetes bacterium]|nr:S9 family peptidase [Armatimonadota bacterium]